jgi:hypothetical protein
VTFTLVFFPCASGAKETTAAHRRTCKTFAEDIRRTTKGKELLINHEKFSTRGTARIHRERGNWDESENLFGATVKEQNFRY